MRQGLLGGQGRLLPIISVVPVSSRVRPDLGGRAAILFSHETSEGDLAIKELQELLSPQYLHLKLTGTGKPGADTKLVPSLEILATVVPGVKLSSCSCPTDQPSL